MIHPGFSDVKETRDLLEYKPMKKEKKKKKKRDHQVVLVRVGVEGVETDEELLTGSKDRWHFQRIVSLLIRTPFACHFSFFFHNLVFFFFCHGNLIYYPASNAAVEAPLYNTMKKRSKICFAFPFFFPFSFLPNGSSSDKDGSLLAAVVALFHLLFDAVVLV
jgi:hypothetical protein